MSASNAGGFTTVRARMRALGIKYGKKMHMKLGAVVRERYLEKYGQLPEKRLLPKTLTKGSHCFAIYPVEYIPEIDSILLAYKKEDDRQQELF